MGRLSAVPYRLSQFRASIFARLSPADREWVDHLLPEGERRLFYRMPPYDQTHSVLVAREVERSGGEELLVRAALLHDCGKTLADRRVPLLYRGLVVVLEAIHPRLLRLLGRPWGPLWPVHLHVHHPELGARELEAVGSPAELVKLVRRHQDESADPSLRRLQSADARH